MTERIVLPTSDHGVSGSSPTGGEIISEPKRRFTAQFFEWNTVESDVKLQLIPPSTEPNSTDNLSLYSVDKYSHARWQWNIVKVTSAAQL